MKTSTTALAFLAAAALPTVACAYTGQQLEKTVKIDVAHARTIAHRALPGTIVATELEREAGGTGIRYTFDIKAKGVLYEVGVDANTGAVLENAVEPKTPD